MEKRNFFALEVISQVIIKLILCLSKVGSESVAAKIKLTLFLCLCWTGLYYVGVFIIIFSSTLVSKVLRGQELLSWSGIL